MSFMKFLTGMGKQKTKEMGKSISGAIVSWDPMAASEVQITEMQERFESLSLKVEKARGDWKKEDAEAVAIQANYDKKKKAAQLLQGDLTTLEGDAKVQTEEALNALVDELEELKPDVEIEVQEAVEAKAWFDEIEKDLVMFADKLKMARKNLDKAIKGKEKAGLRTEKALDKAKEAEERNGIRSQTDALDDVLGILNDQTAQEEAKAAAANSRTKLLDKDPLKDNDLVAAALKRASGDDKPKSTGDRLASL